MRAACLLDAAGLEAVTASRGSGTGGRRRKAPRRCHCHVTTNDRSPRERTERGPAPPRGRVTPVPGRTTRRPDTTGHRPPETTRSARPGAQPAARKRLGKCRPSRRRGGASRRANASRRTGTGSLPPADPANHGDDALQAEGNSPGPAGKWRGARSSTRNVRELLLACQGLVGPAVYTINTRGRNTRASLGVPGARAPSSLHCAS